MEVQQFSQQLQVAKQRLETVRKTQVTDGRVGFQWLCLFGEYLWNVTEYLILGDCTVSLQSNQQLAKTLGDQNVELNQLRLQLRYGRLWRAAPGIALLCFASSCLMLTLLRCILSIHPGVLHPSTLLYTILPQPTFYSFARLSCPAVLHSASVHNPVSYCNLCHTAMHHFLFNEHLFKAFIWKSKSM